MAGARQLVEPAGTDAVGRGLVFLDLLVGDAEHRGELFLRQPKLGPPRPDAGADMVADALDGGIAAAPGAMAAGGGGLVALSLDHGHLVGSWRSPIAT